ALHVLALMYVGEQLDAAASYFFALFQMGNTDDPRPQDWLLQAESAAYFFAVNAEAWRRFCTELGITADTLTAANHHGWFLHYCEQNMPANAPTTEALHARFRGTGREAPHLVTPDDLLASWQSLLTAMTRYAPPEAGKGRR